MTPESADIRGAVMKKLLEWNTTYFALWVVLGGLLAYLFPAVFVYMCIVTASIMAEIWRRRDTRETP